jgi:hypothetical protein
MGENLYAGETHIFADAGSEGGRAKMVGECPGDAQGCIAAQH